MHRPATFDEEQRRQRVLARSTKGAIHIPSAAGRGIRTAHGAADARILAGEAARRALRISSDARR